MKENLKDIDPHDWGMGETAELVLSLIAARVLSASGVGVSTSYPT